MPNLDRKYWDELATKLNSRERDVRLAAISTLADHSEIQAVRLLLQGLNDNSSVVRDRIGEIIREKDHPAIVPGLMALLDSDVFHVRSSASEILKSLPPERSYPHVRKALDDDKLDASLRIELIPVVARGADPSLVDLFVPYLHSNDSKIQTAAMEGLIQSSQEWALNLLIESLSSQDSQTRARAVDGLIKSRSEKVFEKLLILMTTPGSSGQAAVEIIARLGNPSSAQRIAPLLEHELAEIRHRALVVLNVITPLEIRPVAMRFLFDSTEVNRSVAASILEKLTPDVLMEHVAAFLNMNPPRTIIGRSVDDLCAEGIELMSWLITRSQIDAATQMLDLIVQQDTQRLGPAVVRGVGREAGSFSIQILQRWIKRPDLEAEVISVLGEMKTDDAVLVLIEGVAFSRQSSSIRDVLLRLPEQKLEKLLLQSGQGESVARNRFVIALLGRIGSEKAIDMLTKINLDSPFISDVFSSIAEIALRSRLKHAGWDTMPLELDRLRDRAIKAGWATDEPLSSVLERIGKGEALDRIVATSRDEIAHYENLEATLRPRVEQVKKIARRDNDRERWLWVNVALVIAAAIATAICFVMNWQPKAHSAWYGGLAFSVLFGGLAGFNLRRLSQRAAKRPSKKSPVKKVDAIRERLDELVRHRERAQKRLQDAEQAKKTTDAIGAHSLLNRLIEILLSLDARDR